MSEAGGEFWGEVGWEEAARSSGVARMTLIQDIPIFWMLSWRCISFAGAALPF